MEHVVRTLATIRFALSSRRDLLLEILALRHQLAVRARPNRRSDRLTVYGGSSCDGCGHGGATRWCSFSRPASIAGTALGSFAAGGVVRDVLDDHASIRRVAIYLGAWPTRNRLWGAPRIHGEQLGVVVSERTVSRYLRERLTRPSQTWRTCIANHLGQFECNTQMLSPDVSGDDLVDASPCTCRPISSDWLPASRHSALLDGRVSARGPGPGLPCTQDHLCGRTGMRRSASRAPPRTGLFGNGRTAGAVKVHSFRPTGQTATATRVRPLASPIAIGTSVIRTLAVFVRAAVGNVSVGESRKVGILAKHNSSSACRSSFADSVYPTCRLSSDQWLLEKSVSPCFVASFARRADDLGRPRIRFEKPGHYSGDERPQHEPQQPEHAHATKQTDEHQ